MPGLAGTAHAVAAKAIANVAVAVSREKMRVMIVNFRLYIQDLLFANYKITKKTAIPEILLLKNLTSRGLFVIFALK